jgi:CRISPR-associated protein Cmr6
MTSRLQLRPDQLHRAHPGLRLDKFMDIDEPDWKAVTEPRLDDAAYRLAYRRWEQHWSSNASSALSIIGRVHGRLAVGLGSESVLEVGIRLSHSYGTPIVPGSAIKGVLRSRMEDERLRDFLFGSQESPAFTDFQDAWWIPDSRSPLSLDVMTVHHPDYYSSRAAVIPAPSDLDNPNPVKFLSARGSFLFVVRFLAEDPKGQWLGYIRRLLRDTLENEGIGGKRSAGYGRFIFGR